MEQIPFPQFTAGHDSTVFSSKAGISHLINLYRETIQNADGEHEAVLYKTPGLASVLTYGVQWRGMIELNEHVFAVVDGTLLDIDRTYGTGVPTAGISNDGRPVVMAIDQLSLLFVSAGVLYAVNSAAMTTPATPAPPISVAKIGGYWVILSAENQIFFSPTGLVWDPLDFQTAELAPNLIIAMIVDHNELWLIGNRVSQVFTVGPDPNTPFIPRQDGVIQQGTAAASSIIALDNSLFWLGQNVNGTRTIVRMDGYQPKKVSMYAGDNTRRLMPVVSDCIGMGFQLNGHSMAWFTFPTANRTLCYDATEDNWYEVGYWNVAQGVYERHRANCMISAFDKIFVGDYANGKLFEMSPDFYSDDGNPIRWLRRCPHITSKNKNVSYARFELTAEVGVGLDG